MLQKRRDLEPAGKIGGGLVKVVGIGLCFRAGFWNYCGAMRISREVPAMFSISRAFHKKLWSAMLTGVLLLFAGAACAKVIPLHASLHPCAGVQTSGVSAMKGTYNTVSHIVTWKVT